LAVVDTRLQYCRLPAIADNKKAMNWDDLRIVAAVRDEGSYAAASARLRIDETTVARRLARLQASLGFTLFEAVNGVREPTPQCEAILSHVQEMAWHVGEIGKIGEGGRGPVARFRIASTNAIAEEILAPRAGRFLIENPGLTLQFLTSAENVNFSRWEADFAIRLRKPDKGNFTITKLAEVRFYFLEPAQPAESANQLICCYPGDLDATPESRFLIAKGLQGRGRCITDNVRIMRSPIAGAEAAGVLPEYMCKGLLDNPRLQATPLPKPRDVWLLVQNHLKRDDAARLVIAWIRECFSASMPVNNRSGASLSHRRQSRACERH
jgi:DNA-binding transcriptional LysR family regulator